MTTTILNGDLVIDYTPMFGGVQTSSNRKELIAFSKDSQHGDFKSPTPYSYQKTHLVYPFGFWHSIAFPLVTKDGCLFGHTTLPCTPYGSIDDVIANSEDRALGKYNDILRGRKDSGVGHDLLVSIFESPELKSLYAQMKEIMRSFKALKFLKLMQKASPAVIASEYYLLWTFGIAPLIGAMTEILQTLEKGMIENEEKIKATAVAEENGEEIVDIEVYGPYTVLYSNSVRTSFQSVIKLNDIETVLLHQFGLSTPGASYWAVLPLSFVLDWFIDIGGYLDTLEYMSHNSGFTQTSLFKSQTIVRRAQYTRKGLYGPDLTVHINEQSIARTVKFSRSLLDDLPLPHLPSFKPRLNGGKVTSLFALAIQLLHG